MPEMISVTHGDSVDKSWDRFVEQHTSATVAHLAGWGRVIGAAYGHAAHYLTASDEAGEIVGVLPLVAIRSRLFGRALVSMPFLDYGGVLAEPGSEAESHLLDAALDLARDFGAKTVGLRQFHPTGLGRPIADERATMLLPLSTVDAAWKALPSERRNRVRKGQKLGLTATWTGREALDDFYRVFAVNMRDLGSPVHGRGFFEAMLDEMDGVTRVLIVRDADARVVGAAICLFFRDTIMVPWVSSLREAFALCPNFVLYWEVIRHGAEQGYRTLDLGRSFKHAGTYEFKRQWGAQPYTLPWLFVDAVPGAPTPVDRDASRFGPLIAAWKRLPITIANTVGPWIRRQVPN